MQTALGIRGVEPSIVRIVSVTMIPSAARRHGIKDAWEWPLRFAWTPVVVRLHQPSIVAQKPMVIRAVETWPVRPAFANQIPLVALCCGMRPA